MGGGTPGADMSAVEVTLVLGLIALGTYAARALPILLLAGRVLPVPVQLALRNVAPAVFAALIVISVSSNSSPADATMGRWPEVVALIATGVVARWRRNLIWAMLAGLVTLWLALWVVHIR